jgi:hypothetical protein
MSVVCRHDNIQGRCSTCDAEVRVLARRDYLELDDIKLLNASQRRDLDTLLLAKRPTP